MPIPPIFLHQRVDISTRKNNREVIDGQQRLRAIIDFVHNESFNIMKKHNQDVGGMYFSQLDDDFKKEVLQYEIIAQVINEEFGNRFTAINKTLGADSTLSRSEHGLMVATILAGNSGKGAKGASVYGVSFGEVGTKLIVDKSKYEELYNSGVRIFNQSFGTPSEFSDYNSTNYKLPLRPSVLKEKESTVDVLDRRIDEINDFYKMIFLQNQLGIY